MRFSFIFKATGLSLLLTIAGCMVVPGDCHGKDGACSVADHEASQPVLAGDLKEQMLKVIADDPKMIADALQAYRQKQMAEADKKAKEAFAQYRDAIYSDSSDIILGDPNGDVTLVEWYDYSCPICHGEEDTITKVLAADSHVRLVLKPMAFLDAGSTIAAKAVLASIKQGKSGTARLHHLLMTDKTPEHQLAEPKVLELASQAHLDVARLKADMETPETAALLAKSQKLAQTLHVGSTPTLFVGQNMEPPGALPFEMLTKAIATVRNPPLPATVAPK